MNESGSLWTDRARENLRMCDLAYRDGIWTQTCFHAQQCVEIMLKAYLANSERRIPRTNTIADLLDLMDQPIKESLSDLTNGLRNLDLYYAPTRYPDAMLGTLPDGLPGRLEATEALSVAKDLMALLNR